MKKMFIAALTLIICTAFALPASALDHKFGGYWRTRAYTMQDFSGDDSESMDRMLTDTRTRLYYTAVFNENLKFVNKFEMDAVWGSSDNYGDIGADGRQFEIKNSYIDAKMGNIGLKVGAHGETISRGFIFDDDASGIKLTFNADKMEIPLLWLKHQEGGIGKDANDDDSDYYGILPVIKLSEALTLNPVLLYVTQDATDKDVYFLSLNADVNAGKSNCGFTGIYQFGETGDFDHSAFLLAVNAGVDLGALDVHGKVLYSTGDDNAADTDLDAYDTPTGASYYWAEIMGYGMIDEAVSNGSPADQIENLTALNIGTTLKPSAKLTVAVDLWYAMLTEEDANGEDELGTEIDIKLSYELIKNLNMDVVAAYLAAGDATGDEDPVEIGTQLSLSF